MRLPVFLRVSILIPFVLAAPKYGESPLTKRCVNSADDRSCWGDYDISTNYYNEGPDTGVVREYWWNIVNTTAAPDGIERVVLSVNGSVPGPTIIADWGDTIVIRVKNSMPDYGTGIHFHGIRQNYTNQMDGVPSITQCPIAPGTTFTYTWKATQYGSSWYHSHFYVQAWDGIFGGIQINGPATANYDEDLGTLTLSDWSHVTAEIEAVAALAAPPTLDNGLINGTNTYNNSGTIVADTHFKFSIDNHTIEVIAADFVPIVPYTSDTIAISMGQRYDIIVTANAAVDNYWMRAVAQIVCSKNVNADNIYGIIRYDSTSTDDPTSVRWTNASTDELCEDELMSSLVPHVPIVASDSPAEEDEFSVIINKTNGVIWQMGTHSFLNQWDYPTLLQSYEGNDTRAPEQEVYQLPEANVWVYWIIETTNAQSHHMHLHGHDFWVLGQGTGTYDSTTANLTLVNAPRRDVVLLPGSGWVVMAFYTDNPGAWIMHCHIAWHTSEGLAVQILERESELVDLLDGDLLNSTCAVWNSYASADNVIQPDSGI